LSSAQPGEYAQRVSIVQRTQAAHAIANWPLRRNCVAQSCVVLKALKQLGQFYGCQLSD
jgi:hypothetical protein